MERDTSASELESEQMVLLTYRTKQLDNEVTQNQSCILRIQYFSKPDLTSLDKNGAMQICPSSWNIALGVRVLHTLSSSHSVTARPCYSLPWDGTCWLPLVCLSPLFPVQNKYIPAGARGTFSLWKRQVTCYQLEQGAGFQSGSSLLQTIKFVFFKKKRMYNILLLQPSDIKGCSTLFYLL